METKHSTPDYIFIVGVPRTGTKLLTNILNGATQVHCAISSETHFVGEFIGQGGRGQMHRMGSMEDDANVSKLVEAMFSEKFAGNYWRQLADGRLGVKREDLLQALLKSDRSDREIYRILLRISPKVTDTSIAGDKTPTHLFHVPTLLQWFPRAKIIHTFRDPRAIHVSQIKKARDSGVRGLQIPFKPGTHAFNMSLFVYTMSGWMRAASLHNRYRKQYPDQYYLLQFEQLVTDPGGSLEPLCRFLNIPLEPSMLTPLRSGSSYKSRKSDSGFDQEALTRWQNYISPTTNQIYKIVAGKYMREFGYI